MSAQSIVLSQLRARRSAILFLAAANFLIAFLAAAPISPPLASVLDQRPIASAVADSPDDGPRAELLEDHPEITGIAVNSALLAIVLWWVASWIFAGGILSDEFLVGCARHWRRMLAVGALGLPLRLLGLVGPLLWIAIFGSLRNFSGIAIGAAIAAAASGLFWSLGTVTLDRASGIALADPTLSSWKSLRAAARLARKRFFSTLQLALISGLGFLLLAVIQILITQLLPATALGSLVALFAAMAGAIARAGLSVFVVLRANA